MRNPAKTTVEVTFVADVSDIEPGFIGTYLGEELDRTDINIVGGKFTWKKVDETPSTPKRR